MQPRLIHEPLRFAGAPLMKLQSDERLVRLVRSGSHPAFAELVHRYRPALVRYASRIVGEQRGEDVVQQGLASAHTALMADDRPIELKPWLYRIAHNAALNALRGDRELLTLDDHEPELVVPGAERQAEQRERFRTTLRAVQALPTRQRDALLLRELEGRSHDEIAAALGVTPGAARQHLMRARVTLRAAVTAITPYPLLLRLTTLGADGGLAGLPPGDAVAGAGLGLGLSKVGAGLLAAGVLAGGTGVAVVRTARPAPSAPSVRRAADGDRTLVPGPVRPAGTRTVALGAGATATAGGPATIAHARRRDPALGRDGGGALAGDDRRGSPHAPQEDGDRTSGRGSSGGDPERAADRDREGSSDSDDAVSSDSRGPGPGSSGSGSSDHEVDGSAASTSGASGAGSSGSRESGSGESGSDGALSSGAAAPTAPADSRTGSSGSGDVGSGSGDSGSGSSATSGSGAVASGSGATNDAAPE